VTPRQHEDSYARQKLYEAVGALIGDSPIDKRLRSAPAPARAIAAPANSGIDRKGIECCPRPLDTPAHGEKLADRIFSMFVEVMGGL
jgi:hypothetical protein